MHVINIYSTVFTNLVFGGICKGHISGSNPTKNCSLSKMYLPYRKIYISFNSDWPHSVGYYIVTCKNVKYTILYTACWHRRRLELYNYQLRTLAKEVKKPKTKHWGKLFHSIATLKTV